jgi:hypothetical protein
MAASFAFGRPRVAGGSSPLLSALPAGIGIAGLAFSLSLPRLAERGVIKRAPGRIQTLLKLTAESIRDTKGLLLKPNWRLAGTLAYLWCDIGVLVMCFAATGHSPPLAEIVLAYQIGYLSSIIPVPGNIGVLDGTMTGMLVLYGVSATPQPPRPSSTTRSPSGSQRCWARSHSSSSAARDTSRSHRAPRSSSVDDYGLSGTRDPIQTIDAQLTRAQRRARAHRRCNATRASLVRQA